MPDFYQEGNLIVRTESYNESIHKKKVKNNKKELNLWKIKVKNNKDENDINNLKIINFPKLK